MLTVLIVVVVAVATVHGGASPARADLHPGNEPHVLFVAAELEELVVRLPVPEGGSAKHVAYHVYGGSPIGLPGPIAERPDYLVLLYFGHDGHAEFLGSAVADDFDHRNGSTLGPIQTEQVLYSAPEGIDAFDRYTGVGDTRGVRTPENFYFLRSGPEGYYHLHCGGPQEMFVEVKVYEIDDSTTRDVTADVVGAGIDVLTDRVVAIDVLDELAGEGSGWLTEQFIEGTGDADYVGGGSGYVYPNGVTQIDLYADRTVHVEPPDPEYFDPPFPRQSYVDSQYFGLTEYGVETTVLDVGERDPSNPFDSVPITLRENRGTISIRAHTAPTIPDLFQLSHPYGDRILGDQLPSDFRGCGASGPSGVRLPPKTPTSTPGAAPEVEPADGGTGSAESTAVGSVPPAYGSEEAATELALAVAGDRVPLERVPDPLERYVTDTRVNVHVDSTVIGVSVAEDGTVDQIVFGGVEDPGLRVRLSAADAHAIAHDPDPIGSIERNVAIGAVEYEGVGPSRSVAVAGVRLANGAYQYVGDRFPAFVPGRHAVSVGETVEVSYDGEPATLSRSVRGYRLVDSGGPVIRVVDRRGVTRGVTTRGAQRVLDAPVPDGWTDASSPSVGVYGRSVEHRLAAASGGV